MAKVGIGFIKSFRFKTCNIYASFIFFFIIFIVDSVSLIIRTKFSNGVIKIEYPSSKIGFYK